MCDSVECTVIVWERVGSGTLRNYEGRLGGGFQRERGGGMSSDLLMRSFYANYTTRFSIMW